MSEKIRKARRDDFEPLMRFLERSNGTPWNYFINNYNHLIESAVAAEDDSPEGCYIIEDDGRILSHVGLYPIDLLCGDVRITAGGIGNVATHPEARGRGYMTALLERAVSDMEGGGVCLSVLWGDRHRYGNFGWETSGARIKFEFTARSIEKAGSPKADGIEEVDPAAAAGHVEKFHNRMRYRADRGDRFEAVLSRAGNRVWLSPDGYICGEGKNGALHVNEAFSASGNEAGFIASAMKWCFLNAAYFPVCSADLALAGRLVEPSNSWEEIPEGMFRVNSWNDLLLHFLPLMEERARESSVGDFGVSLRIGGREEVSIRLSGGKLQVLPGSEAGVIEISDKSATRYFIGGPRGDSGIPAALGTLTPLPLHVQLLDYA